MNKMSMVAILALSTLSFAGSYSDADVEKLIQRVNALETQVKKFRADTDEQIEELHARADTNEFNSALNRIKWGGEFETSVGNYSGKIGNYSGKKGDDFDNNNKWDMKLKLSMDAKINDKTTFSGRLSMLKGWSDSDSNMMLGDSSAGRTDGGSALYVERAYIDYKISDNLIATIGRQPSSDGPGMSLIENTPRKATYPSLLFNGNADGLVFTYKIPDAPLKNAAVRFAYGKGFQWDSNENGYLANKNNINDLNVYGFFAEASLPFAKMGENLVVLSAVMGTDFIGNEQQMYDATNPQGSNQNLGDFKHYGIYFENNHAFGTNLSYFASFGYSDPHSNGKSTNIILSDGTVVPMALLNDTGYAYHLGARYDVADKYKFGYEFNHGSKNWFSYTSGATDTLNKLATRGNVHDLYFTYQLDMNQFVRLGYTHINYDYSGSGWHIGTPMKTNDDVSRAYMTYNVKF